MKSIEQILTHLYPEDFDDVLTGLDVLKKKYVPFIETIEFSISHKDCILITYADGIKNAEESSLITLNKFAEVYIKETISAIHLLPFFPYSSDDGFSVIDYYEIKKEFGEWKDIERLKSNFSLMFDAVVNHISQHSNWFKGFLKGDADFEDYFIVADLDLDYSKVIRPRALPLHHSYQKKNKEVMVWTTFSEDQIDLNYSNYKVFLHVLDVLLFYISKGAKYLRLDAIAFLWKTIGTECLHLKETHMIIQAYRSILDEIAPQTVLITETNVPHEENVSYFGNGTNEAHMVYNFTLPPLLVYSLHKQDTSKLTQWANNLKLPGNKTCFFNFTASHDGLGVRPLQGIVSNEAITHLATIAEAHGGYVSYKDNGDGTKSPYELNCNYLDILTHPNAPEELRIRRFLLTQSVMLCMPGVPGVYYHSLLGSLNDKKGVEDSGIKRRINREKLQIEQLVSELNDTNSFRFKVFNFYKRMLEVRNMNEVFDPFGEAMYETIDNVFIIKRSINEELFYGVHNFTEQHKNINVTDSNVTELISNTLVNSNEWNLKPFEFKWFKQL